ncbi:PspC domain-containing protein [Nocardioides nitrophenolicus]|uniref:PspC domain-containing protein n=1 Tax=Nocardioides nitrophenolicus TaxID=60489 RepID=UPI00195E14AB|nr:PspC domain-containing protein [Nocardioides nitrophenolicus]MBM7517897.1 phage shock protein PspC (stress-responsive transcriptional regulator) [Nocardioides nitrophenolicus]
MTNYDNYSSPQHPAAPRRLTRREHDKMIGGVCAGVAAHLNVDVTVVRLLTVALTVFTGGAGLLVYLAGWWLMPRG